MAHEAHTVGRATFPHPRHPAREVVSRQVARGSKVGAWLKRKTARQVTNHAPYSIPVFSPPRAPQSLPLPRLNESPGRPAPLLWACASKQLLPCRTAAADSPRATLLRPHAAARILYWPPATSSLPSSTIRPRKRCSSCPVKSECVGTHAVASTQEVGCAYGRVQRTAAPPARGKRARAGE